MGSTSDTAVVLARFLKDKAPNIHLIVHRDRDYMEVAEVTKYTDALEKFGIHVFVTSGNDVEAHFCDPEHIALAEPRVTADRATELVDAAVAAVREKSIETIINLRTERAFRRRADGGGGPNHGEIGTAAARDFDASPRALARGKALLGKLTAAIQQEIGNNPTILKTSTRLADASLDAIAKKIWPPVN